MKRVLAGMLASTFAVVVLIFIATEMLVRWQVAPSDTRAKHLHLLETTQSSSVAFGDSHVARGFDAQDGFINLAYPSENISDMLQKADTYFADHAPERVILQADPHLFANYRLTAASGDLSPSKRGLLLSGPRHRPQLWAYWTAFFKGFGKLRSTVEQTEAGSLLSSGDLSNISPRVRQREGRQRLQSHQVSHDEALLAKGQQQYAALVDFFTDRGAQICFVTFPVSPAYAAARDGNPLNSGHDAMMAYFAEQATRVNAQFWDARSYVTDLNLFRDVDHLNAGGAVSFSDDLQQACGWR